MVGAYFILSFLIYLMLKVAYEDFMILYRAEKAYIDKHMSRCEHFYPKYKHEHRS